MKFAKNKTKAITIALFLVLTMATTMAYLPTINAEEFNTYAFLTVAPHPVGVNQTLTIVMWLDKPTPTASGALGDHWQNYILTITKPDGTNKTLGPYTADAAATATARYAPDTVGQYYFQFSFPGQWINTTTYNWWYNPSHSTLVNITVQQEPVPWWPQTPLPTDYWARPIEGENVLWSSISGNWLQDGYSPTGRFAPYTTAPNTAHIVWTKETGIGGLIGGEFNNSLYYSGQWEESFRPPVIINGRVYYNDWSSTPGGTGYYPYPPGFTCIDLRTGETLWRNTETTNGIGHQITCGQVYMEKSPTEYGGWPCLWKTGGTTYKMYDAYTGVHWLDLENATGGGKIMYDENGGMLVYILNGANNWLAMWNSTLAITHDIKPGSYAATQWRPVYGSVLDWRKGIQWNVTVPDVPLIQNIVDIGSDIIIANNAASTPQTSGQTTYVAYSLKPGQEGQQLWVENITVDPGSTGSFTGGPMSDGVFTRFVKETMQWYGFDAFTGKQLWGPTAPYDDAYGMYGGSGIGAYGNFYTGAYDGKMRAYNIRNGTLLWTYYSGDSGFTTPYGEWPFYNSPGFFTVADGKVIAPTSEHHLDEPAWMGWKLHVINATTGKLVWNILGYMQNPVVADGYLLTLNEYDNREYCFGKGKTAITVSAPLTAITQGQSVMITGTVTDQSPGAKGTPAIADESMTQWMEYLYMQKPKPDNATGVTVMLDVIDSNNNYRNIGTVTSDSDGLFHYKWTPDIPGEYVVIASFAGSESYWPSHAETAFGVDATPEATPGPTPTPASAADLYFVPATAGIIVAIAVVGALMLLMLRKRP